MSLFCRHNRLEQQCPVCQRERRAASSAPPSALRHVGRPQAPGTTTAARKAAKAGAAGRRSPGLVTRRLARADDDGFRSELMPGVKATADARRLADALGAAAARLDFPGPHPELAELTLDAAVARAFALAGGVDWDPAKFRDDPAWSPQRRFARLFDRVRLPGFGRAERYEFLVLLAAAGQLDAEADALFFDVKANDATTLAAKRALNSGDAGLLERRARALADAAGVPLAALDRGLALWDATEPLEPADAVRAALRLPA